MDLRDKYNVFLDNNLLNRKLLEDYQVYRKVNVNTCMSLFMLAIHINFLVVL